LALGGGRLLARCRWRLLTLRGRLLPRRGWRSRRAGCRCPWRARCAGRTLPPALILRGRRSGRQSRRRLRRRWLTRLVRLCGRRWRWRLLRRRLLRNRRGRRRLCRPLAGRLLLRRTAFAPLLRFLAYGGTNRLGRRRSLRALRLARRRRRSRDVRGGRWTPRRLTGRQTFRGRRWTGGRMRGGRRTAGGLTGRRALCGRRRTAGRMTGGRSFRARRLARRLFRLRLRGLRCGLLGALGRGRRLLLGDDQRRIVGNCRRNGCDHRQHAAGEKQISSACH